MKSELKEFLTGEKHDEPELTTEERLQFTLGVASVLNLLVGVLVLAIFVLGTTLLYQSHQFAKSTDKYETLLHENNELKLENIQLRELSKDKLEKMKRGAQYIEKHYGVEKPVAQRYALLEMLASIKYNVPYSLGLSITAQESSFNHDAVSYTNCCLGGKQINYKVWKEYFDIKKQDLFKPEVNIDIGYHILRKYADETGSMELALQRYYGSTVPEENQRYAQQVISRAEKIARALKS